MSVKPITPTEAAVYHVTHIPDEVIAAVNKLLAARSPKSRITILQDEVIEEALKLFEQNGKDIPSRDEFYKKNWLDFEPIYRKAGWNVYYDKPGYNESYKASFEFCTNK